jgi:anaerobic selenocysteine-containing dehydrogenase
LLGFALRTITATELAERLDTSDRTAAAVQVNNLVVLRGMLGRPGCGVLQMIGQPTAQNTRECGANGDLPGFRNWENSAHIDELAELWNVEASQIPHYAPPTHAMQLFRYAEQGSIKFLWISGTDPAVSLPELARIRSILSSDELFVVVQDLFLTETAALADVVLPAATWGETTGVFTNADRTVHLSEKVVDPPGQARPDLDIFLAYAAAMGFDRPGRRTADQLARRRVGVRCVEAVQCGPAPTSARATGATSSPAPQSRIPDTGRSIRTGRQC